MATKTLPYENARSGDGALIELQKILMNFGCTQFGTMQDTEQGETLVQFKWKGRTVHLKASWRGYAAAFLKVHPYTYRTRGTKEQHEKKAYEQGKVAVCSILRDWIKGQVTAVETGLMTFDAVFMPFTLLPNGRTVNEYVIESKLLEIEQ